MTGLLLVLISTLGFAQQISTLVFVQNFEFYNPSDDVEVDYFVNRESPELGRAWLRVSYTHGLDHDGSNFAPRSIDVPVSGLAYDALTSEIIYSSTEGIRTVCATQVPKSSWSFLNYKATGKCRPKIHNQFENIDNGLTSHEKLVAHLTFEVDKAGN